MLVVGFTREVVVISVGTPHTATLRA